MNVKKIPSKNVANKLEGGRGLSGQATKKDLFCVFPKMLFILRVPSDHIHQITINLCERVKFKGVVSSKSLNEKLLIPFQMNLVYPLYLPLVIYENY